ncbi:hypothetical protein ROHU_008483 [Labeo rohita]|uniref:Uncharacterized protein n=1 Tax=Labeo rohita TaxID=84645 RepID=A0A498M9L6_LABRO|nr:hypothetical protein ROHU_008483 [Labeo rohita]
MTRRWNVPDHWASDSGPRVRTGTTLTGVFSWLNYCNAEIGELDHYKRRWNLRIKGLPEKQNENLREEDGSAPSQSMCVHVNQKPALCGEPPSPDADGDMIVTLDANFGLVRKQSSGTSAVEPLHGTRVFVDEKDVEEYLLSHLDSSKPQEIKYSTRRLNGFGLTDREGMEWLCSFLQRFAKVTKEMTPSHHLDLLTDALSHYGRRKSTDLGLSTAV